MNRIILIGNGFDLAHGLKTSYKDFIDDLWRKMNTEYNEHIKSSNDNFVADEMVTYIPFTSPEPIQIIDSKPSNDIILSNGYSQKEIVRINYKNPFFKIITEKTTWQNWVDIEEEYYRQLQGIYNKEIPDSYYTDIKKLNEDFEKIKKKLEEYLINELNNRKINSFDLENISQKFNIADFSFNGTAALQDEYFSETEEEKKKFERYLSAKKRGLSGYNYCETQIYPKETLLLNFNYTDLPKKLINYIRGCAWELEDKDDWVWAKNEFEVIQIHGELNNPDYPIIFGYGDETGKEYEEIEKLNDYDFLENIKSIKYSETSNYGRLLNFINSDKYQVFIMGHSCGLSDRTLLKTLFEDKNCVSIKIRMFKYKNSEGKEIDDFSKISRNMSRHFSEKKLMREKLVNKEYSK
ncbi:MAG: bacteriophage abortive infection AbiH family protein [Candidatus Symbiothrix sp.]|jgi:hypothetical protein|nr:bacteriophage abortive infection AbiH family protein [Candidatus Symbiothrix sp.]